MILHATLNNRDHPEIGEVTIPFPIPEEEYAHCLELLAPMGLDDPVARQCNIVKVECGYQTLSMLEGTQVNLDELDYLSKRLDSFVVGEDDQFEAMACLLNLHDVRDFINLTFCCQQATVITDFTKLEQAGREHYLNTHGGGAPVDVLNKLDTEQIARDLIASGQGKVTPYGVVYDNGMEMEQCYRGHAFPGYLYGPKVMDVELEAPRNLGEVTVLQLPMPKEQLDRMLIRGGFGPADEFSMRVLDNRCPTEVSIVLGLMNFEKTTQGALRELNEMCRPMEQLASADLKKLDAIVAYVQPEYPFQIRHLAENLEQFEFVPDVKTSEEYGRYMIQQSEQFDYDPNLEPYYDYEKYGADHVAWHGGKFTSYGFVAYMGTLSLEELMIEDPSGPEENEEIQMGGGMA